MSARAPVAIAALLLAAAGPAMSAGFEVRPGPATISAEEAALAGEPGEHAVILVIETIRTDRTETECIVEHHARAKILANAGRGLANLGIPVIEGRADLLDFWGRVLLPDGRVLELSKDQLESQSVVRSRTVDIAAYKGALPGVVPGAVIDYGWKVRTVPSDYTRLEMQGRYRVLAYRLGFRPRGDPSRLRVAPSEGRDVRTEKSADGVWVFAGNLPPVIEEPMMPPLTEVRTAAHLYYVAGDDVREDYWGAVAQHTEIRVRRFNRPGSFDAAIAAMGIAADDPLDARLRKAYAWLDANVRRSDLRSTEERERSGVDDPDSGLKATEVLAAKEGTPEDLDRLFLGLARELGAEARLVFVPDRTDRYFDAALRTLDPFAGSLVAVRPPDAADPAWTFVDPGSGLPYGEVPWYFAGQPAPLLTGKQSAVVTVPASPALRNASKTEAVLRFSDGGATLVASWSRTGSGQNGFEERRLLRALAPRERQARLGRWCGEDAGWEVLSAGSPGLDAAAGAFETRCEAELDVAGVDARTSHLRVFPGGPWIHDAPDLGDADRVHPVVFPFPRIDRASIEIVAPDGLLPEEPPAPVTLSGRFGDYAFVATRTERGFSVSRTFVLKALVVPVADFDGLREFLARVRAADRTALSFAREEPRP